MKEKGVKIGFDNITICTFQLCYTEPKLHDSLIPDLSHQLENLKPFKLDINFVYFYAFYIHSQALTSV